MVNGSEGGESEGKKTSKKKEKINSQRRRGEDVEGDSGLRPSSPIGGV